MRWDGCEWNPVTDNFAYADDEHYTTVPATALVGANGVYRLCESCAALPKFQRMKKAALAPSRLKSTIKTVVDEMSREADRYEATDTADLIEMVGERILAGLSQAPVVAEPESTMDCPRCAGSGQHRVPCDMPCDRCLGTGRVAVAAT